MGELLRIENLTRTFPGVVANDAACLDVQEGEILALLGENGAGKTTLMNCLYGLLRPDSGRFLWRGKPVEIPNSHAAVKLGIGMVHQHFMLVPVLTVVENVSLGLPSTRGILLDLETVERRLLALSREYGLEVTPRDPVWQLPVGAQQRVEILKALYRNIELLILDEPTAVLTPREVEDLFAVLKRLTAGGMSVILITHKLDEVMAISDRSAVMRDGKVVGVVKTRDTSAHALASLMVGRDVVFDLQKPPLQRGKCVLDVADLSADGDRGIPALRGVSFQLHAGEIFGIAGVDGNGQRELEDVLSGLRPTTQGRVLLDGRDLTQATPRDLIAMGVAHIASDRHDRGVALKLTVEENLVASHIDSLPYAKRGILDRNAIRSFARQAQADFSIQTASLEAPIGKLSGGNQQRVVLASALGHAPRLLIAAQPTRGLDVGLTQQVYERLLVERTKGTAILLISTELQEIFRLSDRIGVMYRGELMGVVDTKAASIEQVGLLMAGIKPAGSESSV